MRGADVIDVPRTWAVATRDNVRKSASEAALNHRILHLTIRITRFMTFRCGRSTRCSRLRDNADLSGTPVMSEDIAFRESGVNHLKPQKPR
jgi:hypothetical protein